MIKPWHEKGVSRAHQTYGFGSKSHFKIDLITVLSHSPHDKPHMKSSPGSENSALLNVHEVHVGLQTFRHRLVDSTSLHHNYNTYYKQ